MPRRPRHAEEARQPATRFLSGTAALEHFFSARGWSPWAFQRDAWRAYARGNSGLIHVPTGAGKTYAAFGGPLIELADECLNTGEPRGVRVIYLTPLRAVSRDIELALKLPIDELSLPITVGSRTGDTSASVRAKQREKLPNVLITTPESLSLMLTWEDCRSHLSSARAVIIDEWHELLSSKRGTQTELGLARLRGFAPGVRTWALSATLANLDEAAAAAVGPGGCAELISAPLERPTVIETVLPGPGDRFPWAGHMGLSMLPRVVGALDPAVSTLIFTNTRSQAERWFQAILTVRPEWEPVMALHHGSIDRAERQRIESGLKDGTVRLVVATSSLDLGVDFAPVERVMQIGSPKGIARLMQRAGRSGHRPGATCRILCVPTHGLELIEIDAVRRSIAAGGVEPRVPTKNPIDVLVQHLVTCGMGGGFDPDDLFAEVRRAYSFRDLLRPEFDWAMSMVREGGGTLRAYPQYHRIQPVGGVYRVPNARLAHLHRLNIGTIVSDGSVRIAYLSGRSLGNIEENFVNNLAPKQTFVFAGKVLEFVKLHDMVAYVRPGKGRPTLTPIWDGTRLPISESLGQAVRETLERAGHGERGSPELVAAAPIVEAQSRLSRVPAADEVLVELAETREGSHLFVYPFEGRLVHGGLAALLAFRLSRRRRATFSTAMNDYGLELLTARGFDFEPLVTADLFDPSTLAADTVASVNLGELGKSAFREIARVSGLVFQNYPGSPKSSRQLHANSSLIYDVFREFDPGNPLLRQAEREVMERQFEQSRLARTMDRIRRSRLTVVRVDRPTPLGFPLIIERLGARLSSESIADRVESMTQQWQKACAPNATSDPPPGSRRGRAGVSKRPPRASASS